MEAATVFSIRGSVEYSPDSVVSKQIIKKKNATVTLFAFDKGQTLSEHTAPFDAIAQITEGEAEFIIDGRMFSVQTNQAIILPANIPHAVNAIARFKMLLTMLRE